MSSIPGMKLEDYVAWNYDLVVNGQPDTNWSLMAAESIGSIPPRRRMSASEFAGLVGLFEPYRQSVETALQDFDDENQSWRDYAGCVADCIPDEVFKAGGKFLDMREQS